MQNRHHHIARRYATYRLHSLIFHITTIGFAVLDKLFVMAAFLGVSFLVTAFVTWDDYKQKIVQTLEETFPSDDPWDA